MKSLKILFVEDVNEKLSYTVHELEKEEHGYYKLKHVSFPIKSHFEEFLQIIEPKKYCYVITLENKVLEYIHKDKIHKLNPVVENLFRLEDLENKKDNSKVFTKKRT